MPKIRYNRFYRNYEKEFFAMKLKKIVAGVIAAATLSTVAVGSLSASAETFPDMPTNGYTAFLMFSDQSGWFWANFGPNGYRKGDADENGQYSDGGYGQDAVVTGDGTYTVSIVAPPAGTTDGGSEYITGKITNGYGENIQTVWLTDSNSLQSAAGAQVFCVDICNIVDGTEKYDKDTKTHVTNDDTVKANAYYPNGGAGPYKASQITISDVKVTVDGEDYAVDQSKLVCGNIESNTYNYRIEIYNTYGVNANDPAIDADMLEVYESLSVTFTIGGLDSQSGSSTTDTTASDTTSSTSGSTESSSSSGTTSSSSSSGTTASASSSTTSDANTGVSAGLAVGGIAFAGVAIVLTKKRRK